MTKNLLVVTPSISGGGLEKVAIKIANGISNSSDFRVSLASPNQKPIIEISDDIEIVKYKYDRFILNIFYLYKILKKENFRRILTHSTIANILIGFLNLFFFQNKLCHIGVEHNTPSLKYSNGLKEKFLLLSLKMIYPRLSQIVAVSKGVRDDLVELGIKPIKIKVIYNPVLDEKLIECSKEIVTDFEFEDDKIYLVSASRLEPQKRVQDILDAYERVMKVVDNSELIILGTGSEEGYIKERAKNISSNQIHFLGFKNNPYKYMQHCDLYVLGSRYEGFGLVLVEAMACGLNVVSTDCPSGPREILNCGEFGDLVEVGNVKGLSEAMVNRLKNPLSSSKLQNRSNHFNSEQAYRKYIKALRN